MKTVDYLDAIKARHHLTSDYQLFKFLDVSQQSVSKWRQGKGTIGDEFAPRIAAALDIPTEKVLADLHAERERNPALVPVWRAIAAQYARAAGIAAAVAALNISVFPSTSDALTGHFFDPSPSINSRSFCVEEGAAGYRLNGSGHFRH